MLERLHFVLGACVGEGTHDSDCIVALEKHGEPLEEEGALAVVVCACVMRLPRSPRKSMPSLLIAPIVSAETGTNKYDWASDEYLFFFLHYYYYYYYYY